MSNEIRVAFSGKADKKKEVYPLKLHHSGQSDPIIVDVDGNSLLKVSRRIPNLSEDLLVIAAAVYGADQTVSREAQEDNWKREIAMEIPVRNLEAWEAVSYELSNCISFLTGDVWQLRFSERKKHFVCPRPRQRRLRMPLLQGTAVSLFSGGLDSLIGAIDWLTENKDEQLLLVGHYDGKVGGPSKDQLGLAELCKEKFGRRFRLSQTRVGALSGRIETSFRSRSFLFLAQAAYRAELIGEDTPIIVPENGPIALNFPLTPARRGSCSTRTVHPFFLQGINSVFASVGLQHRISNPYELKTKGEMVKECLDAEFLKQTFALSRSCAKMGHKRHWVDRQAGSCGVCVPCLFRRASLHQMKWDNERFGLRIENMDSLKSIMDDPLALAAFVRRNDSDRAIATGLLSNGSLPPGALNEYVDLVKRMRTEVHGWMRSKGSVYLKGLVGR
ncbi:MAG: hypothetical protein P1U87_18130 [Verrucomicrobiales bacterium]|nr:hypothetical protein [Verrucomicrobiales bacterium]